jgi:hypothetical protein
MARLRFYEEKVIGRYKVECSTLTPSFFDDIYFAVQFYWKLKREHCINCKIMDTTTNNTVNTRTALDF